MSLKLKITSLLVKTEATVGTDANPTGSANAVLLTGNPTLSPLEMTEDQRNLVLPYFGNQGAVPSSAAFGKLDFSIELAGSGVAATPPAYGPILRACALSETITAAPIAATAQAGGSTTTIKLDVAASAVNDFYNGMPISITAGTGSGQSGLIVDYDGTTKIATVISAAWVAPDATSAYSIGANVAYRTVSKALEAATMYFNIDGVRHVYLGARGTVSLEIIADKIPRAKISMTGVYVPVADSASPNIVVTAWKKPLIANSVNTPFFSLHGFATSLLQSLTVDYGNAINKKSLIGATHSVEITDRKVVGQVSVEAATVATKDWFAACRAATEGVMGLIHGTTAGSRFALSAPNVVLKQPKYADNNGTAMIQMAADIIPLSGNDEFNFVTY